MAVELNQMGRAIATPIEIANHALFTTREKRAQNGVEPVFPDPSGVTL
jgi:hypothetical protein